MKSKSGANVTRLGVGTYLGHINDKTDQDLDQAIKEMITAGVNHFDTAPNYRAERSEGVLGNVLHSGQVSRDDLLITTKVGFLPFRKHVPADPSSWINEAYVKTGIVKAEDILGGVQSFSPEWISFQVNESLRRLKCQFIDVLYLHNLETGLRFLGPGGKEALVRNAFSKLAELHETRQIRAIGIASWGGFIEEGDEFLSLETIHKWADAENCAELLRYIQVPFNLSIPNALFRKTQSINGQSMSIARAASELSIDLISSAPLFHGRLATIEIPGQLRESFPTDFSTAQICLKFALSAPGIRSTVLGVKSRDHIDEVRKVLAIPDLTPAEFATLLRA